MDACVRWCRRVLAVCAVGSGLLACLAAPEFHQVGEGTTQETTTTTTPSSTAGNDAGADTDAGGNDDGEDPTNYVPDGGMAGPGTSACGGQICAPGRVCCSGKCKNPKTKC